MPEHPLIPVLWCFVWLQTAPLFNCELPLSKKHMMQHNIQSGVQRSSCSDAHDLSLLVSLLPVAHIYAMSIEYSMPESSCLYIPTCKLSMLLLCAIRGSGGHSDGPSWQQSRKCAFFNTPKVNHPETHPAMQPVVTHPAMHSVVTHPAMHPVVTYPATRSEHSDHSEQAFTWTQGVASVRTMQCVRRHESH